jgi:pimeloyl-ACP methyl ester carboxylesterase
MKRRHCYVMDMQMHWQEAGSGTPVVLVHGFATSPSLWRHVVPEIRDARCLAWEMVGYGSSIPEGMERDISASRQADYLLEWMSSLRIERAVFVGHDLGGAVAQIAAARRPRSCAALVLINSFGYDAWPTALARFARLAGRSIERMPSRIFRIAYSCFLRLTHADRREATRAFVTHWRYYALHGAGALVRQARALDLRDTRNVIAKLRQLELPVSVIWSAKDRFLPIRYGFRFARDLNAAHRYVCYGRHFTPEDRPQLIATAINEMLAGLGKPEQAPLVEKQRRYG